MVGPARAADVIFVGASQNSVSGARTLRIPATGELLDFVALGSPPGYLTVGVAISDDSHRVATVAWVEGEPAVQSIALGMQSARVTNNVTSPACRSELWGLAHPRPGAGHVVVTVEPLAGNPPAPALAGSIAAFTNVGSTSIGGPCCADSTNDGSGTTTINKTMFGTSRGDALVNTVCTNWNGGPAPGTPGADPALDPEMVPRTFLAVTSPNLQHFLGTSPGADVERPATSYRHLRWLQSGSRVWSLAGLVLIAGDPPAAPLDAGTPPSPDARAPAADTASAPAPDTSAPTGPTIPRIDVDAGAAAGLRELAWKVGCACELGSGRGGPGASAALVLLLALLWRRSARSR
jgi:hypothetical protein